MQSGLIPCYLQMYRVSAMLGCCDACEFDFMPKIFERTTGSPLFGLIPYQRVRQAYLEVAF